MYAQRGPKCGRPLCRDSNFDSNFGTSVDADAMQSSGGIHYALPMQELHHSTGRLHKIVVIACKVLHYKKRQSWTDNGDGTATAASTPASTATATATSTATATGESSSFRGSWDTRSLRKWTTVTKRRLCPHRSFCTGSTEATGSSTGTRCADSSCRDLWRRSTAR